MQFPHCNIDVCLSYVTRGPNECQSLVKLGCKWTTEDDKYPDNDHPPCQHRKANLAIISWKRLTSWRTLHKTKRSLETITTNYYIPYKHCTSVAYPTLVLQWALPTTGSWRERSTSTVRQVMVSLWSTRPQNVFRASVVGRLTPETACSPATRRSSATGHGRWRHCPDITVYSRTSHYGHLGDTTTSQIKSHWDSPKCLPCAVSEISYRVTFVLS